VGLSGEMTFIISLLRELKIGIIENVKYKRNDTENFNVENLLNVRKEKPWEL